MNIKFQTFCLLSLIQVIVCVCVCVCVYVHVHIIVYMSVSAYVCEHECVCVCMCVQFCVFSYSISNISNILSFISYVLCTLPYFHSLVFHMFMKDIYQIQCIYSFLQDVCVCAQARIYTEKLLVIILPAKKFCKQYFLFTQITVCLLLIIYTIKKGKCLNSVSDSFSKHRFFTLWKKSWLLFYMVQSLFIYMKRYLCSAHLNFGQSTHKFLHINQLC